MKIGVLELPCTVSVHQSHLVVCSDWFWPTHTLILTPDPPKFLRRSKLEIRSSTEKWTIPNIGSSRCVGRYHLIYRHAIPTEKNCFYSICTLKSNEEIINAGPPKNNAVEGKQTHVVNMQTNFTGDYHLTPQILKYLKRNRPPLLRSWTSYLHISLFNKDVSNLKSFKVFLFEYKCLLYS